MQLTQAERDADELIEYVVEHELCVQPDSQTFECCDCTLCREAFQKRVIRELMEERYEN